MDKLIEKEMAKRDEIVNTFHKNYLLEAGAGAGKTTIIVERVINHILSGDVEPRNIVAITFTKAASLELAERIERKALDYIGKEKYAFARDRLEKVEEIFTGTIHSFCELLLREMPFEAGLTPGYEIVEDSQELYKEIWYDFLRRRQEENQEILEELKRMNIDYRELRSSAFVAMDNPDIEFTGFKDGASFEDSILKFQELDASSLDPELVKKGSNLGKLLRSIIEDKGSLEDYIDEMLKEFAKVGPDYHIESKLIYKKHIGSQEASEVVDFIKSLLEIYEALNATSYNTCTDFINRLVDFKDKYYSNQLTFNDLLYRASRLIKESRGAREHFKSKFKCFYIDETQDTDPMQAELLLLMSHEGEVESLDSIDEAQPRPGSLFIVGDPKQSIYRFRRADISIYENVKDIIRRNGEVVYLDINFRSVDSICDWVEKVFKDRDDGFAFLEEATDQQAGFQRILTLWKDRKQDEDKLSGVYGYEYDESLPYKEEEYIAAVVEDILKNKTIDEKVGKTEVKNRPVENKDIMILTKSNEETGRYLKELKRRNIPGLLAGEKRLADNREVLNLSLLVDFLTDPEDRIKLVASLRNCFYLELGTVEYLLQRIADAKKNGIDISENNYDSFVDSLDHPILEEALVDLQAIFRSSQTYKPITFIEKLIKSKRGVYDTGKRYNSIEKRDADSALFQTLELLKSSKPISLYDINEELREIVEEKVSYELPINMDFAENAVRVMNIHKAKGLEADIVILVGSDKGTRLGGDSHYVEKEAGKNYGYMAFKRRLLIEGPDEEGRKAKEREFKEAEQDRLIYVAATRTKSVLITPYIEDKKMFLSPLSLDIPEMISVEDFKKTGNDGEYSSRKLEEIRITERLRGKRGISKASYERIRPSQLDIYDEEIDISDPGKRATPSGMDFGNMVHRSFELLLEGFNAIGSIETGKLDRIIEISILDSLKNMELNSSTLKKLYPDNNFPESGLEDSMCEELENYLKAELKAIVNAFLSNEDAMSYIKGARKLFIEFPFTANVDSSSVAKEYRYKNLTVNGFIDLLIEGKDGNLIIMDYKTDRVRPGKGQEHFNSSYVKQLNMYKSVLENRFESGSRKVEELLIYSTYLDKVIPIES